MTEVLLTPPREETEQLSPEKPGGDCLLRDCAELLRLQAAHRLAEAKVLRRTIIAKYAVGSDQDLLCRNCELYMSVIKPDAQRSYFHTRRAEIAKCQSPAATEEYLAAANAVQ